MKLYRAWKDNEANLTKKRELKSRLELSHKTDKLNETNREISEVQFSAVVTHAGIAACVGIAFSRVCLFVCLFVRALKGNGLSY